MKVLITGGAGFIGFWLARSLADNGHAIVIVDNINDYYDQSYKYLRLSELGIQKEEVEIGRITNSSKYENLRFLKLDITDRDALQQLFEDEKFTHVVNLAAQPGVRWSLNHPFDYIHSNIEGFLSVLEAVRNHPVEHFVYASSSSVYGSNKKIPFSEEDRVESPESLYAATKRSNELMAEVYAKLYKVQSTGLRFFTVYGPWGRPDMAPMIFARAILAGEEIKVFNHGDMQRDFTYIEDIVNGIEAVLFAPKTDKLHHIYNIGHGTPINLMEFINILEAKLGKKAQKCMLPMQPGDVTVTYADTRRLGKDYGYRATTPLSEGLEQFASWLTKM